MGLMRTRWHEVNLEREFEHGIWAWISSILIYGYLNLFPFAFIGIANSYVSTGHVGSHPGCSVVIRTMG